MSFDARTADVTTQAAVNPASRCGAGPCVVRGPLLALAALAGAAWGLVGQSSQAMAQGDAGQAPANDSAVKTTDEQLLDDFSHYVLTANLTMAESTGAQLLARAADAKAFAQLVEAGDVERFQGAATRALKFRDAEGLQAVAGALLKQYEDGRLARARDPQVVAENIAKLTQGQRAKLMGRNGLVQAGEYAMPQLLEAFLNGNDPALAVEAQNVMIGLGRQAIVPLTTAMMGMGPTQQERIVRVLGAIPYKSSLPALADLAASTQSEQVRTACQQAIQRLGGATGDAPALYRSLAEAYYDERSEVTNFPGEDFQLLWNFNPSTGLGMNAIRTPVFHEALAMQNLERAMNLEAASGGVSPDSLALWVASNYSREFDTPQGYRNPAYPVAGAMEAGQTPRRSAEYFGIASGPDVAQRVLARALSDRDTNLARRAIAAIERTAGGKVASETVGGSPLVAALVYPNRRVQTEAALAIARSQPAQSFGGSERVVPTLASAVQAGNDVFAAVLAPDVERYQPVRAWLESAGFKVLPHGQSLTSIEGAIVDVPNIDLVVATGFDAEGTARSISEARGYTRTSATPVLALTDPQVYAQQQRRFESDRTVAIRPLGTPEAALTATVDGLIDEAAGGRMSPEEAEAYAARSLESLRDLAMSRNSVLNVADAAGPLVSSLQDASGQRLQSLAGVLAMIGGERSQRALLDKALASEGEARIGLLASVADSARRFGNQLEERQVAEVTTLAGTEDESLATAAAAVLGALNLPNSNLLPLITGQGGSMVGQR